MALTKGYSTCARCGLPSLPSCSHATLTLVQALIDGTWPASAGAAGSGPASASATGSEAAEEHAAKRHKGPVPSKL